MGEIPYNQIRNGAGLDWMGKVNGWMIGTDCEKLAKGAWRLIVLLLVQVLFEKMISIRSASSFFFRDECVYTYIPRYFMLEMYNAFFISSREFFLRVS